MRKSLIALGLVSMLAFVSACSTTPKTESDRAELEANATTTMGQFRASDADIAKQMNSAYGMAIFPKITKGGAIVGGAGGRGIVYEGGKMIGYSTMSQATVGAQLGGQEYSQMILFENREALNKFTGSNWEMSANATAVAAASGAGAAAKYKEGVMVYLTNLEGLMAEASIGGQKFSYERSN